ncbi:MAG: hypothetical protein ABI675_20640 [Chitinophagaceae bacterium]
MLKSTLLYSLVFYLSINSSQAQTGLAKADTLLTGTWKGTSICQKKNSPCHDETVVYHISKKQASTLFILMQAKLLMVQKKKWAFYTASIIK